ncbi:MAG: HAMP domain-containing protein [Desulfomonile tiedjei]|uniref:histidine kinase n=1 Tax=Desulfomonile tiedjei TaxID=2358 RepID=A0A9D6V858_9BACT|nr:HAMP domain-containing protein [Desulfomonile tiedjei]
MAARGLLWKLLAINIIVIGFVIALVWLAIDYLAAGYFMTLMEKYKISPESSHQMFVDSVHRYLIWASLAALVLAAALSFLLTRRVLAPLSHMIHITKKFAAGDYFDRVKIQSRDEFGQLATAFNLMAENLCTIEQLRKRMLTDVAHELRTPLTNILGYLEALMDGLVSASRDTFELLHEETMRLVRLVEDILRLAKADAARVTLLKMQTDLGDLIMSVLETFRPQFMANDIAVDVDFSNHLETIFVDAEKMIQVVSNLLQNALQYTAQKGRLRIFAEKGPGTIKVVFANTGTELSETDLPFIFERFYRGEKSRSRESGGAGIGLAIVKELIEAHNGSVGAGTSQGQTRVWFSLPV